MLLFSVSIPVFAEVQFTDEKGRLVFSENDIKIRLIDKKDTDIKTAEAVFTVNASVRTCFEIITAVTSYPEFMPDIKSAVLYEKRDDCNLYDFIYDAPFLDIEYKLKINTIDEDSIMSVTWSYIEGDLKDNSGSWTFITDPAVRNKTLIYYSIYLDPGTFLPDWLVTKLTAGSIPDMIESLRKRVSEK